MNFDERSGHEAEAEFYERTGQPRDVVYQDSTGSERPLLGGNVVGATHEALLLAPVLDALAACCGCIGTIEDDDHWKAQALARKILVANGRPDPCPYLGRAS